MPRVPTYDNFQTTPNPVPQAQVRPSEMPDVAGQQLQQQGQAFQQAGGALNRIALDAVAQANQVRINDAMNKAVQAKLRLTYDQAEGFTNLRGDAALTRPDGKPLDQEYTERFQKQLGDISQNLGNDAQRQEFMRQAGQLSLQFQGSLTQHVAKEFTEYQIGVQKGTIATARDQMALAWDDPKAIEQSANAIKAATAEEGKLRGWSGQQIQAAMVDALSPGHATVIASAVDSGKLDFAREYAKQVNAELTPQARLQIKKALDEGDFETRTQNKTDEILAKFGGDTSRALAEVRATMQGKEEDAVVQRIKAIDSEREALRERAQRNAADRAWQFVAQGKAPPPSLMAALDGRDAVSIRKTLNEGPAQKTDPNVYYALSLAAAGDPKFREEDLRRYADKLTPGDFRHFVDLQAKSRKPGEMEQVATATQQMGALAQSLGFEDKQKGAFFMEANKALFAAQQEKGRALDQAERQKVLDRLVVSGEITNKFWNTSARKFEARQQGREVDFKPAFSDADRNKATAALQRRGIKEPTKEQIEATIRAAYGM